MPHSAWEMTPTTHHNIYHYPATQPSRPLRQNHSEHWTFAPSHGTQAQDQSPNGLHQRSQWGMYYPSSQWRTHLGRSTWEPSREPRRRMWANVNFQEAALAIKRVIMFVKTLPNADDRANARCQIRKQQMQQAESCGSSSTSQAHQALSHPGANVYRPPMLCQQPPHLDVAVMHPNSAATNQNTTGADPAEFSALLPETVGSHTMPAPSPDILATETSLPSCCKMTMHPNTENTPNILEKIQEKFGKIGKKSDLHSFDTYSSPIPPRNTPALETNPPNPHEKTTLPNAENTSKIAKKNSKKFR